MILSIKSLVTLQMKHATWLLQEQCYQQIMGMFMKITVDAGSLEYSREPSVNDKTSGYRCVVISSVGGGKIELNWVF